MKAIMVQPRLLVLLLLLLCTGVFLLVILEMNNMLPFGGCSRRRNLLKGQETAEAIPVKRNSGSQGVSTRLAENSPDYFDSSLHLGTTNETPNGLPSQGSYAKLLTSSSDLSPSSTTMREPKLAPKPLWSFSEGERFDGKRNFFLNINKTVRDRLVHLHGQRDLNVSREQLNRRLQTLVTMPVVEKESILRVLEVSYFRAGSTFLGDILQQNWKTFYHFEPLQMISFSQRIDETQSQEALEILSHLFRCEFDALTSYVRYLSYPENWFLLSKSSFLWGMCRVNVTNCFLSAYMSAVCRRAQFQVMKVMRVPMHYVQQFLKDNPDLNVKVVHLVRDPRGIMASRMLRDWCSKTSCGNPKNLCLEMHNDLDVLHKMKLEHPERFIEVRYEDLALNTSAEAKVIYEALGLPFTSDVQKFINSHTHASADELYDPYSTRRNSSVNAFRWKHQLTFEDIKDIQKECEVVMDALGYRKFESREDMLDDSVTVVTKNYERHNIP